MRVIPLYNCFFDLHLKLRSAVIFMYLFFLDAGKVKFYEKFSVVGWCVGGIQSRVIYTRSVCLHSHLKLWCSGRGCPTLTAILENGENINL